jgi:hypothetical protein
VITLIEWYKKRLKKNKNIVSDNTWEEIIIIKGDKTANKSINFFSFGKIILPALNIIIQVSESIIDCNIKKTFKFLKLNNNNNLIYINIPGILSVTTESSKYPSFKNFKDLFQYSSSSSIKPSTFGF